ncbi:MAG TPA: putative metal-dependent hydrolase [Gemmatimonadales bacterium]|nr:putative metal-dependent hydrolase [Gemmatimonadales bacterium]
MSDLRYPIGQFEHEGEISGRQLNEWIEQLEELPEQMRQTVEGLSDDVLDTPYRPGGWTIRQVVHHVPDSHMNCYLRLKWALTEDDPVIKTYHEERWAELPDSREAPVQASLDLLASLHVKLVTLLRSLTPEQLLRRYTHPDSGPTSLAYAAGIYAWHGRHHLAHITNTLAGLSTSRLNHESSASVPTTTPGRYIAQLCRHFAHKVPADYEPHSFEAIRGRVEFPDAGVCTLDALPNSLELSLVAMDPETLHRLEGVVERHLLRFAWREPPVVNWTRSTRGPQPYRNS